LQLLFDNNLSVVLPELLQPEFPGSVHVSALSIDHLSDRQIWQYALEHQFTIVTKDKDFYHLANTLGNPPKLIWLAMGNCRNKDVINSLLHNKNEIKIFLSGSRGILILK
jgi:predicted nuclease of predicted toxin-antitoxin system